MIHVDVIAYGSVKVLDDRVGDRFCRSTRHHDGKNTYVQKLISPKFFGAVLASIAKDPRGFPSPLKPSASETDFLNFVKTIVVARWNTIRYSLVFFLLWSLPPQSSSRFRHDASTNIISPSRNLHLQITKANFERVLNSLYTEHQRFIILRDDDDGIADFATTMFVRGVLNIHIRRER